MITAVLLWIFPILLYGEDGFKLNGKLDKGKDGEYIMLFTFKDNKIHTVDTTRMKDHSFTFTGKEYLEDLSIITYGNYPDTVWSAKVILERGTIDVRIGMEDIITGTPLNESYQAYTKEEQYFHKKTQEIYAVYQQDQTNDSIYNLLLQNAEEAQRYAIRFIKENINNLLGKIVFIRNITFLKEKDFTAIYEMLDDRIRQDPEVKEAVAWRKESERLMKEQEKTVNQPFIDFELTDERGDNRRISEVAGQSAYLYIDFWASRCGPCMAEVPHLKKIYEKYRDKGFEILGISIDTNELSWKSALKKLEIPWVSLVDLKGGSEMMEAYNFKGIPYGLLIDKTRKILEVGLRAETLEITLSKIIQ